MTILGDKLAAARAHQGWSLREAEKRTGIPNAHLSQMETGAIQRPGLSTLIPLAAVYGIPVDELAALAGHDVAAWRELSGNGVRVSLVTATDPAVREWMDSEPRVSAMLAVLCANPDRDVLLGRVEEMVDESNRRKLRLAPRKTAAAGFEWLPERSPPWNKGLTLTRNPSLSTVRREVRAMEAGGLMEVTAERTGKPGRPPHLVSPTKKSWAVYDATKLLERVGFDTSVLSPRQVDVLISAGYAARRDDGTVAFLKDYQAWWKYWNSKREAADEAALKLTLEAYGRIVNEPQSAAATA